MVLGGAEDDGDGLVARALAVPCVVAPQGEATQERVVGWRGRRHGGGERARTHTHTRTHTRRCARGGIAGGIGCGCGCGGGEDGML